MKRTLVLMILLVVGVGVYVFFVTYDSDEGIVQEFYENQNADADISKSEVPTDVQAHINSKSELIQVSNPLPLSVIESPLSFTGQARGLWFFEASFPVQITDWNGLIIGQGVATADGEWMTEEFVPFSGTITFTLPEGTPYRRGSLIFSKDNPSGLPEHDDALEIPVRF